MYDSEAILNPDFRLLSADDNGVACKDLYMQTFFRWTSLMYGIPSWIVNGLSSREFSQTG